MVIACPNCTARLQLEDAKLPSRSFTLRCPKCQSIISAQAPGASNGGGALAAAGDLPVSTRSQREMKTTPAPVFQPGQPDDSGSAHVTASAGGDDVAQLLAALLERSAAGAESSNGAASRRARKPRRALVCAGPAYRDAVACELSQNHYEVFVAEDKAKAIERMREDQMDVVILDPEFDPVEQGAAFINSEVNSLRPAERRRLFFVHLSPAARTADPHAAFINHVNLVVKPTDVEDLPRALERAIRDFNNLYGDFFKALNVAPL